MQVMAIITAADDPRDDRDFILEILADRIRGAVEDILDVESVQVGLLMNMDDALVDIKRHLEEQKEVKGADLMRPTRPGETREGGPIEGDHDWPGRGD